MEKTVNAVADVDDKDDDASDLETEPTVPKTSTTEKVAVPKTSKKRGARGPYKKKGSMSITQLYIGSTHINDKKNNWSS